MDASGKRCLACGFNGDGHYTHCIEPYKKEARRLLARIKVSDMRTVDPELLSFITRLAR